MQKKTYYLRTPYILIIGPELQGKTTLAKLIKEKFSGKSFLISHKTSETMINQRDYIFQLASEFSAAAGDNQLVIIDSNLFMKRELEDFFEALKYFMKVSKEEFTIIKVHVSYDKNMTYANRAGRLNWERIVDQRARYEGEGGSLYTKLTNELFFFDNSAFDIVFAS